MPAHVSYRQAEGGRPALRPRGAQHRPHTQAQNDDDDVVDDRSGVWSYLLGCGHVPQKYNCVQHCRRGWAAQSRRKGGAVGRHVPSDTVALSDFSASAALLLSLRPAIFAPNGALSSRRCSVLEDLLKLEDKSAGIVELAAGPLLTRCCCLYAVRHIGVGVLLHLLQHLLSAVAAAVAS